MCTRFTPNVQKQIPGLYLRDSDSVGLGWGPGIHMSNKFSDVANGAGPWNTLSVTVSRTLRFCFSKPEEEFSVYVLLCKTAVAAKKLRGGGTGREKRKGRHSRPPNLPSPSLGVSSTLSPKAPSTFSLTQVFPLMNNLISASLR